MLSGSHLMAHVFAAQKGWDLASDAPLKIVHTLDGARAAMKEGEIDAWLWEKFTTKFLVDQGEWDIIGEVPTPWPCFCFVASDKALQTRAKEIQSMVEVTKEVCDEFKANLGNRTISYVVKKHASTETDASEWLSGTQWACALEVLKADFAEDAGGSGDHRAAERGCVRGQGLSRRTLPAHRLNLVLLRVIC